MSVPKLPSKTQSSTLGRAVVAAVTILVSLAGNQHLSAQTGKSDLESYTVRGTVVNSVTLAPVERALVVSTDNRFAQLTDAQGHFAFKIRRPLSVQRPGTAAVHEIFSSPGAMQSGGFSANIVLVARKPGYFDSQSGPQIIQGDSDDSPEIKIALVPEALIVGRVNLPANDGTQRIGVEVYRREVQEGRGYWASMGSRTTRANGEFRFPGLRAGEYKLFTQELLDRDPLTFNPFGQLFGYPPTFYPAAAEFESATVIRLKAGEIFSATLTPMRQKYYPVKLGVLNVGIGGGLQVTVQLQGHRGPGYSLGYNQSENTIQGMLPSGNYSVEVTKFGENGAAGVLNFDVAGAAVEGPSVMLASNSKIEIHVDDERTKPSNRLAPGQRNLLNALDVRLAVSGEFGPPYVLRLQPPKGPEDESLVFGNAGPASYRLRAGCNPSGYVAAADSGGVNLLQQPLVVGYGTAISPIEITIRDDGAQLQGKIENWPQQAAQRMNRGSFQGGPPAVILLLPTDDSSGQFCQTWVTPTGEFNFAQVLPGDYRAIAFDRMPEELEYGSAKAMEKYEGKGQVLHLVEGQNEHLRLVLNRGSE